MDELIDKLTPELRARYDLGEINVFPGQSSDKPVVRDAKTGALVKGTGLAVRHNDIAQISKATAFRRTTDYQDWLGGKLKIDGSGPDDKESAEWWWERAQEAASNAPIPVTCPECNHTWMEKAGKQDGNLIFRIIELATGKAKQKTEINVKQEEILRILNEKVDIREVVVHALTPEDVEHRREVVEGEMVD